MCKPSIGKKRVSFNSFHSHQLREIACQSVAAESVINKVCLGLISVFGPISVFQGEIGHFVSYN